jgi:hypothetical protein
MLTELDDLLTHQTLDTHDRVILDDPRWTERFIVEAHDPQGGLQLFTGLGIYPNTRYMDGFAIVSEGGEQRNLRAGRDLARDRWRLEAGPLRFDIVEPMRTWRLRCGEGGHGFAFDLRFTRRTQPYLIPTMRVERGDQLVVWYSHFVQAGRYEGFIEVGGRRYDATGWTGERDRSWGVRPASARKRRGLHTWLPMQWDDLSIWVWTAEDASGGVQGLEGAIRPVADDGGEPAAPIPITSYEHDLDLELAGEHRILRGGRLRVTGTDGSVHEIAATRHGPYLSLYGGGYGGDQPQGTPKGELFVDGERWATDPATFAERVPHSILEHCTRFERADGQVGFGCFELCVGEYAPKGLEPVR